MHPVRDIMRRQRELADLLQKDPVAAQKRAAEIAERDRAEAAALLDQHVTQQRQATAEHLARCGLEAREVEWLLQRPPETPLSQAEEKVDAFTRDDRPFLLLLGGVGTGKTVAGARAFMSDLARRPYDAHIFQSWQWASERCRFATAFELSRFSYYGDGANALRSFEARDLLLVDDIGAEYMPENGAWRSTFDQLMNERYRKRKKTILTTNLDMTAFRTRYGERCYSRIAQEGKAFTCGLVDLRRNK